MKSLDALTLMSDPDIQTWLRTVSAHDLALALLDADEPIRKAVYRNMSPRARTILSSDVAALLKQNPSASVRAEATRNVLAGGP